MSTIAQPQRSISVLERTTRLMGGGKALGQRISTELDAHDVLSRGLSAASLHHLIDRLVFL
jgi:hypothetical protein